MPENRHDLTTSQPPKRCPACGSDSLIPVYAHRLCDNCGWHTPGFEKVQFRSGDDIADEILGFLSDLPQAAAASVKEAELRSLVAAWRSRWMPAGKQNDKSELSEKPACIPDSGSSSAEAPLRTTGVTQGEISAARMFEVLHHFRSDVTKYFAEEIMKSKRPLTVKRICALLDDRKECRRNDGVKWVDYYDDHREEMWEIFHSVKKTLKKLGVYPTFRKPGQE